MKDLPYQQREESKTFRKSYPPETTAAGSVSGAQGKAAIFFNKRKSRDKHPDLFGTINIEGREYKIALWKTKSKNGELDYFHGAVREAGF